MSGRTKNQTKQRVKAHKGAAAVGSFLWLARHELRLQWRDMTAYWHGTSHLARAGTLFFVTVFALLLLFLVHSVVSPWAKAGPTATPETLVQLTVVGFLTFVMTLSQAIESITRTYYARADLELLLSSPLSAPKLFGVRFLAIVLTNTALNATIYLPAIITLVLVDHWGWAAILPVLFALNLTTGALGILITQALFKVAGAKRTRQLAQAFAGFVGAIFMIGLQLSLITGTSASAGAPSAYGQWFSAGLPHLPEFAFLPARAAMGDPLALLVTLAGASLLSLATLVLTAPAFSRTAIAATGHEHVKIAHRRPPRFKQRSQIAAIFFKEIKTIWRDPWLLSQVLTQLLYLMVPALILWLQFSDAGPRVGLLAAIIVMAGSQLAGGIAWLTISAEDAPDLLATAPMPYKARLRAKTLAVLFYALVPTLPLITWLALVSPFAALYALVALMCGIASTILVHRAFATRSRRAQFARRHTASRIATLIEAVVSIVWAGTAAAALIHPLAGLVAALPAVLILLAVRLSRRAAFRAIEC